jgi:hypothetical protein
VAEVYALGTRGAALRAATHDEEEGQDRLAPPPTTPHCGNVSSGQSAQLLYSVIVHIVSYEKKIVDNKARSRSHCYGELLIATPL